MSDDRIISESWAVLVGDKPSPVSEDVGFITLARLKSVAVELADVARKASGADAARIRVARVRVVEVRDE